MPLRSIPLRLRWARRWLEAPISSYVGRREEAKGAEAENRERIHQPLRHLNPFLRGQRQSAVGVPRATVPYPTSSPPRIGNGSDHQTEHSSVSWNAAPESS